MNAQPTAAQLIGTWDCYAPGIATELILAADGTYVNTWYAGGTRHWGRWSVVAAPSATGLALQLQLTGAFPTTYQGPLGTVPIQWPPYEWWPLSQVEDGHIIATSTQMVRRTGAAPAAPPQSVPQGAQATATPPNDGFTQTMDAINAANADAFATMQSMHESQQAAFDAANRKFEEYLRS